MTAQSPSDAAASPPSVRDIPQDRPSQRGTNRPSVVVITGLSGAGKSTAIHALEDLGFYCIDNLPTALAPNAVALCEQAGMPRVALGIDVRVRSLLSSFGRMLTDVEASGAREIQVIFLDASDEALLRRFSETRRPHPLDIFATDTMRRTAAHALLDELATERERLSTIRARATRVIDTTALSVHDLRRIITSHFGPASGGAPRMATRFVSFGFKYGTPVDADLVIDVRFLHNPYFVPELRNLAGTDAEVADYVLAQPEAKEFSEKFLSLLKFLMPRYEREGKSYLTIAIGCTGGRHRSVALAEYLGEALRSDDEIPIFVVHRDVSRGHGTVPPPSRPLK